MSGSFATSPASAFDTSALTAQEKTDIRRFCGYPTYGGDGPAGFQGWRFYQAFGLLEFRMNNLAPNEIQNVRYLLSECFPLEAAIWGASSNLDTDVAAVWTHNRNEVRDRIALLNNIRGRLCECVGVPPGPSLQNQQGGSIAMVV